MRPEKHPRSKRQRNNDHERGSDPRARGGSGNTADGERERESVLQQNRGARQSQVACARRAVALRDQQFLERNETGIRQEHPHARGRRSNDGLANEEHAD